MRIGLHGDLWGTFSRGLLGRARQAGAHTGRRPTPAEKADVCTWNFTLGGDYELTGTYFGRDDDPCGTGD
jgi:hypothetical protein